MRDLDKLLFSILRICALSATSKPTDTDLKVIASYQSNTEIWQQLVELLKFAKIDAIVYSRFHSLKILSILPTAFVQQIFHVYADSCVRNRQFQNKTIEIVKALNQKDIIPILCKGILLAFDFYPDFGSRRLGDVDLFIAYEHKSITTEVLGQLGFKLNPAIENTLENSNFIDSQGCRIDVHYRNEFFEGFPMGQICSEDPNSIYKEVKFLTFEPNAFLAFMLNHQLKHLQSDGYLLSFVFDLIFFYRRDLSELSFEKFSVYAKSKNCWNLLDRTNLFLKALSPEIEFPNFVNKRPTSSAFSLAEVRRSRVFGKLGLTTRPRAWIRLVLCWLGLVNKKMLLTPSPMDVLLWFFSSPKLKQ